MVVNLIGEAYLGAGACKLFCFA